MGYNLAIEYMASYEKPWMLDAFRHLNKTVLAPRGHALTEWLFLEVRLDSSKSHPVFDCYTASTHPAAVAVSPAMS